jgi:hypothetical protein
MNPFLVFITILTLLVIYSFYYTAHQITQNPFMDKQLIYKGLDKPIIWLYYDNSDINTRNWSDFGSRNSSALNIPALNLFYQTIIQQNKNNYHIRVIEGLSGLNTLLSPDEIPPALQNTATIIGQSELNWIRSKILCKYSGVWLSPYTICLRPLAPLKPNTITFYGTDMNETYQSNTVPNFHCIANGCEPGHPFFQELERITYERLIHKRGGENIRRDENWDFIRLTSKNPSSYPNTIIAIDNDSELSRKSGNGGTKRIQLEDILATGTEGNLPFEIGSQSVYVPISWTELRDREMFGWFLKMSESQIMESDIAVKYLITIGMANTSIV